MPLGPGVRYRVIKKNGKLIRLAFRGNTVIEAKHLPGGSKHMTEPEKKVRRRKLNA